MVFHLLRSCADQYLGLLYGQMKEEFLKSRYIHCDETRMQVIDEPDQKGSSQNWMWVYLTDRNRKPHRWFFLIMREHVADITR